MNYQVADFIIRIKNAAAARRKSVSLPYTKMGKQIADILVQKGFLESVKEDQQENKKVLIAAIRYVDRTPIFSEVTIVSKPSLRVYTKAKDATRQSRKKAGISILSTSQGILSSDEAKKKSVGGELLFTMW